MPNVLVTKRRLQHGIVQYALLILLIVVVGGYFGYMNYGEFQAANTALAKETAVLGQLKIDQEKASSDFEKLKLQMDQSNSTVNESIDKILPPSEDFTTLARSLDKHFIDSAITANSMFLSDLRFSPSRTDAAVDYATLPFSMNISGDEDGFKQFLDYLAKTGDLNDKSRLLNLSSIALSFQQPTTSNGGSGAASAVNSFALPITASLNLEAYFQKPLDTGTKATN